jgi:predicted restriction endonuclease
MWGCTCRRFVDAHHVQHWADGGETNLDNLVLLCRRHHRLVHEGGFGVHADGEGNFNFSYPDGRTMNPGPDTRFRGNALVLIRTNRENGVKISPETLPPNWTGERMDLNMAVCGLQDCK